MHVQNLSFFCADRAVQWPREFVFKSQIWLKNPKKPKFKGFELMARRNETHKFYFRGQYLFQRLLKHYNSDYDLDIAILL